MHCIDNIARVAEYKNSGYYNHDVEMGIYIMLFV